MVILYSDLQTEVIHYKVSLFENYSVDESNLLEKSFVWFLKMLIDQHSAMNSVCA